MTEVKQRERDIFIEKGVFLISHIRGVSDIKRVKNSENWLLDILRPDMAFVNIRVIPLKNIKPVRSIAGKARRFISYRELHTNIEGFHYIPKILSHDIIGNLENFDKQYHDAAEYHLIKPYEVWKKDVLIGFPSAIRGDVELLIPKIEQLKKSFYMEFAFIDLCEPKGLKNFLDASLYKKEIEKFYEMLDQAAVLAKVSLRHEMLSIIFDTERRLGCLDEKNEKPPRKFRKTLISSFQKFWKLVPDRDILPDDLSRDVYNQIKELMSEKVDDLFKKLKDKNECKRFCDIFSNTRIKLSIDILEKCEGKHVFIPQDIITQANKCKELFPDTN